MKINSSDKRATSELVRVRVAALAIFALACGGTRAPPAGAGKSSVTFQAPVDFQFDSLDARAISSQATRGKPTVLVFVTTSSLAAQAQVDYLVAMAKRDAARVNYAVVAMEERDNRELVELYRKALSIECPVGLADTQTLSGTGAFGDLGTVPVTVMLDRFGHVVWRVDGRVAKSDELRAAMRGL